MTKSASGTTKYKASSASIRLVSLSPLTRLAPLLIVTLIGACSAAPAVVQPKAHSDPPKHLLYVVSHGWHTGLVVPAAALNRTEPALVERFGQPAFYEIGWGDNGFYQARKITTGLTLQAMFWARGAIVHVVAVPDSPHLSFPRSQIVGTCLNDSELDALLTFVSNSFLRGKSGRLVALAPGLYGDAQFYEGTGRYHLLNTCNTWTAKGLRSAGHALEPRFKLTAGSVMSALIDLRRPCAALPR